MVKQVHLYSDAYPVEGGKYRGGYLAMDENSEPISLGRKIMERVENPTYANKRALRYALKKAFYIGIIDGDTEKIVLNNEDIENPGLEIGRLPTDIRGSVRFTKTNISNEYEPLVASIANHPRQVKTVDEPNVTNTIHIFSDGSYQSENDGNNCRNASGVGFIAQNDDNEILSLQSQSKTVDSSFDAEVKGLHEALKYICPIVESSEKKPVIKIYIDCSRVVEAFSKGKKPKKPKRLRTEINRIWGLMKGLKVDIKPIPRKNNQIADSLAYYGMSGRELKLTNKKQDFSDEFGEVKNTKYSIS